MGTVPETFSKRSTFILGRLQSSVSKVAVQRQMELEGLSALERPLLSLVAAEQRLLPQREEEVRLLEEEGGDEQEVCEVMERMIDVHCLALAQQVLSR